MSADPPQRIGVASRDHHGRRPERHLPVDVLGDVHAQEGQIRVGDGVDHAAQTRCRSGLQSEVGAAERDDLRVARGAGLAGQAVRPQPGADDDRARGDRPCGGVHRGRSGAVDETDRDAVADLDTAGHEFRSDRPGDQAIVDDAGVRGVKCLQPNGIRFDRGDLVGADTAQARHRVGEAASFEIVQAGQFVGVEGNDELAAPLIRDGAGVAVLVHQPRTLDAQPGLQRPGLVVDAAVDHPGVVARLVLRGRGFAFQDHDGVVGAPSSPFPGHRQADDPGADHRKVVGHGIRQRSGAATR